MNIVRVAALLVCALVSSAFPQPIRPAADNDSRITKIAESYFAESFTAAPPSASAAGVHTYDAQLGSYAAKDYAAQIARDKRYLKALDAVAPVSLSPDGALDRTMLANSLRDDLLLNETMRVWRHKPDNYVGIASGAIFALISRDFAPPAVRMRSVIARENQIPAMFVQARANLSGCDKESADIAVDDALGTVALFEKTVPEAFAGQGDAATRAALLRSTRRASAATRAFANYLKRTFSTHPSGTYAIGAANYSARLKYEESIDMPLAQYLAVGTAALATTHAQLVAIAKQIDPHSGVAAVIGRVAKIHPTAQALIPAAQAELVRLRAFLIAHRIIDLPPDANIKVTLTPEFERQTSVASMDAPGPLETVATKAYYNVTPVDPRDSKKNQAAYVETFNDFERPIVSAHEVYPGHYTTDIIDKHLPLTLTKSCSAQIRSPKVGRTTTSS
ncbi:MAG: hypothetical protein NVSMB64_10460 [Candidatus Velthaea sp.]